MKPSLDEISAVLSYEPETGIFRWKGNHRHVNEVAGKPNEEGYLLVWIGSKKYRLHRLAWLISTGHWPVGEIDHINRDRSDNRRSNLRDISHQENCRNKGMYSRNKSGATGVYWDSRRNKWRAQITINGKKKVLGRFHKISDAVAARIAAQSQEQFSETHGIRK